MTKHDLDQIYYLTHELSLWEKELERIRNSSLTSSPLPGMTGRSGVSDKVGCRGERVVDLEKRIRERRDEILRLHCEAVDFIRNIPDSLTRQIVYCHCVKLMNWRRVAYEVGGNNTEDSVKKRYYRFLESSE